MNRQIVYFVQAAVIAAIYVVLTVAFIPFSYGLVQVRFSEILTVLPFLVDSAVPGLFVGCLVANLFSPNPLLWIDVILGSTATLIAAYLTSKMRTPILAPLPPVVINAIIVGPMLAYLLGAPLWFAVVSVAVGQVISCFVLGYPLLYVLIKSGIFTR